MIQSQGESGSKNPKTFANVTCEWSLDELEHDSQFLLGLGVEEAVLDDLDGEGAAAGGAVQGEVGEHVDGASAVVGVLKRRRNRTGPTF